MTNFKIILATAMTVAVALLVSRLIQNRSDATLREKNAIWLQQKSQLDELFVENQRLSLRGTQAAASSSGVHEDHSTELAALRMQADALRQQTNTLAKQLMEYRAKAATLLAQGDAKLLEHNHEQTITFAGGPQETGRLGDARTLADAVRKFAKDHNSEFPRSLDEVSDYLPKTNPPKEEPWKNLPLTGTNNFEIVFQGSELDLTNIPLRRVALLRERNPWQTPEGKWVRVYAYADGAASPVESDDNFQSWEAQHIIPRAE